MKFFAVLSALSAGAALVGANPVPEEAAKAGGKKFFLVTKSSDAAFNGLCVFPYHTGAGTADATLGDCGPAPEKLFTYKNKAIHFTGYGKTQGGLQFDNGLVTYDEWGPVTLNVGRGKKGLQYSKKAGFTQTARGFKGDGFIACRWSHGNAKQLFALSTKNPKYPSSCAKVKLIKGCYNTDPHC